MDARDKSPECVRTCSDADFVRWRQFPQDVYLGDSLKRLLEPLQTYTGSRPKPFSVPKLFIQMTIIMIVLILCSTPPHSNSFRPTPAKVDFFVTLGWTWPE